MSYSGQLYVITQNPQARHHWRRGANIESRTLVSSGDHVLRGGGYVYGKYFISKRLIMRLTPDIAHQVMIRFGTIVASDACEFEIPCLGLIVSALSVEGVVKKSIGERNRLHLKIHHFIKH